ncbi:MAG TPA: carbamate kinase [Candidatus Nanoarchaeia archaeon]|nr:carbamate kinase [Candidatus Nanoarchaeia archaeon]
MKKPVAVVALGGNALLQPGQELSLHTQFRNASRAAEQIVPLLKDFAVIITTGNGPQVGGIILRSELALRRVYPLSLAVAVAQSEGEIGYILEQSLRNVMHRLGVHVPLASLLTQVVVDAADPAFLHPSKPIGLFYDKKHAAILRKQGVLMVDDAGRGFRRVVPSPKPVRIVEQFAIRDLLAKDFLLIVAAGGGIPVVEKNGFLSGVDAVIDKDFASSCLASTIRADVLFILTGVDAVYRDFNTRNAKRLSRLSVMDAEMLYAQGHFPSGSMGPKVLAACDFIRKGGKRVVITSPEKLSLALRGKAGTTIEGLC